MRVRSWLTVLLLGGLCMVGSDGRATGAVTIGERAPELVVPLLNGAEFDLRALKGKVVLVNYWATWCPPCRQEMPALNAVFARYHAHGLELLGLSVDRARDRAKVKKVMEEFGYPAGLMAEAKTNEFGRTRVLPLTYVIDMNGVVRAVLMGSDDKPMGQSTFEDAILPLLPRTGAAH